MSETKMIKWRDEPDRHVRLALYRLVIVPLASAVAVLQAPALGELMAVALRLVLDGKAFALRRWAVGGGCAEDAILRIARGGLSSGRCTEEGDEPCWELALVLLLLTSAHARRARARKHAVLRLPVVCCPQALVAAVTLYCAFAWVQFFSGPRFFA